jgi:hypothetical protein
MDGMDGVGFVEMNAADGREVWIGADVRPFIDSSFTCFFEIEEQTAAEDAEQRGISYSG